MELTVPRVSFSFALLVFFVCSAEAMNYLAFPRMGRSGYLAFPRMGRSHVKSETVGNCCGVGLKSEFLFGQDGKEELRAVCPLDSCCEGLREVVDERSVGVFYSVCVPEFPLRRDLNAHSSEVLGKLKNLIEK